MSSIILNGREYSDGITVIANPQGAATETLNTIQIGTTIYQLPSGGGGSSFERSSILLTNNANVETTITVTKVE